MLIVLLTKIGGGRKHLHGLNPSYLINIGFENEQSLIEDFKQWLCGFSIQKLIGNNPRNEMQKLNLHIFDIGLPQWHIRVRYNYHKIPNVLKNYNLSFDSSTSCSSEYHSCYLQPHVNFSLTPNELARIEHGYHCSLADVYELYYFYCENFL